METTLKGEEYSKNLLTFLLLQYIIFVATRKAVNRWLLEKVGRFPKTQRIICFG